MEDISWYSIICIILIIVIMKSIFNRRKSLTTKYPYKKKNLLTKTEYGFYRILKEECDKRNYLICPKVRMEDFLDVTCDDEKLKYRGHIKSRHIDFIICDEDLHMICGIELDDYHHNSKQAQKVDNFKNGVFKKIGLPLYRIQVDQESYRDQLQAVFYKLK